MLDTVKSKAHPLLLFRHPARNSVDRTTIRVVSLALSCRIDHDFKLKLMAEEERLWCKPGCASEDGDGVRDGLL
jgi:hypothetical protein